MFTSDELDMLYGMLSELNVNRFTNKQHVKFDHITYENIRDMKRKVATLIGEKESRDNERL